MSDILEEIQELSNKFSNLFEVDGDGLGQPAVDVPPSQNKIKKDRKTKNGKVEIVSVEDELFPYEGNKKEQYRQKIIDTINDMIQGKATLEDLLQIVRQKKAPLKEALDLLEDIHTAIEKGVHVISKPTLHDKAIKNWSKELQAAAKKELPKEKKDSFTAINNKMNEIATKRGITPVENHVNNKIEEALILAENIYDEINKRYMDGKISVDKALKLEKKFQDKMSPEKVRHDGKELEAAYKDSLEPTIKNVKTLKALRRNNKKKNGGKSNYKFTFDYRPETLEEAIELMEEMINEKNANVRKKHDAEIAKAEKERATDREANPLAASVGEVKRRNQHTMHGLSKYKTGNKYKDWPINNAMASMARETKNLLGRKYYPENPYHEPFVLGGKYHDLHGNLEQKEYEVEGRGKYHPKDNDHRKEVIGTNIERGRKIHPNLPKDKSPEALEEAISILSELFDRPDLLDDIDTTLGSPVKKTFKKVITPKKTCKNEIKEAIELMEELINEWDKTGYSNKADKHLDNQLDNVPKKEGTKSPDENSLEYQNYMRDKVAADKVSSEVWNQTRQKAEQNKANYNPNSKRMRAEAIMRAQLRKGGN